LYAVNACFLVRLRPIHSANISQLKKVAHPSPLVGKFQLTPQGGYTMAGYVLLFQYTDQGFRNVVDTIKRVAAAREMAGKFGIRIIEFLWTMGQYDGVILAEAPNEEAITAFSKSTSAVGHFKTQVLRAFRTSEFDSVLATLK
jgi:uncharacterized protein with GYD domain